MFSSENIKKELLLRKKELTPIYLFRNFWSSSSLEISESLFLMIFKLRRCFRPLLKRFRLWLAAEEPVKPLPTLASILFELVATSFVSFIELNRLKIFFALVDGELKDCWSTLSWDFIDFGVSMATTVTTRTVTNLRLLTE